MKSPPVSRVSPSGALLLAAFVFVAPTAAAQTWYAQEAPNLPLIDISGERNRHVIVAAGTQETY
jgi:hypothetical protein